MTRKLPLSALLAWALWAAAAVPGHAADAENGEAAEIPQDLGAPSLWSGADMGFHTPEAPPSPIFSDLGQRGLSLKLPPEDWAELHGFREYGPRPAIMPVEKAQASKKGQLAEVSARGALEQISRAEAALTQTLAFSGTPSLAVKARKGFENPADAENLSSVSDLEAGPQTAEQPLDAGKLAHLNNLVLSAVLLDNPARTLNFINSQDPDTRQQLLARLKDALAAAPFSAEIIVEKLSTSPEGKQLLDELHRRRPDIQHLRTAMSMDEVDFGTLISVLPLFPELLHTVSQRRPDVHQWLARQLGTYAAKPRPGDDFLRVAEKLDVQELADAFARNPSKHPEIIRYLKLHREGFFEAFELAVDRVREEASQTPAARTRQRRKT